MGDNIISDNGGTGLAIYASGVITIDRVFAIQNAGRGIVLSNDMTNNPIIITNTIARLNEWHGIHLITGGAVTLSGVHSMSNGEGSDGDGLYMRMATPALTIIYSSSFLGNEGSGIEMDYTSYGVPSLIGVSYFGNDTDMDGDLNFYSHLYVP
jgi:hypothetical protein